MIPHRWRRSAADNGSADPNLDVRPNRSASTVLGSIRGLMASGAASRDDAIGELVATLGAGNAYSVSSNEGLIDPATGINGIPAAITTPFLLRLSFDTALGNSATTPHLRVDGFDCGPILRRDATALADGDLPAGVPLLLQGDFAAAGDTKVTRVRVLDLVASDLAALTTNSFPIGGVLSFTGNDTPTGFLPAAGLALSRADYGKLWAHAQASGMLVNDADWLGNGGALQGCYSRGDGATNFRIPHLGGVFLRGLDFGRGTDPNRVIGTTQADAFRKHTHPLTGNGYVWQLYGTGPNITTAMGNEAPNVGVHAVNIDVAGDTETRPVNVAYPFLIRAY